MNYEVKLIKGNKNNKNWYALLFYYHFESGKSFKEYTFLSERQFNALVEAGLMPEIKG